MMSIERHELKIYGDFIVQATSNGITLNTPPYILVSIIYDLLHKVANRNLLIQRMKQFFRSKIHIRRNSKILKELMSDMPPELLMEISKHLERRIKGQPNHIETRILESIGRQKVAAWLMGEEDL